MDFYERALYNHILASQDPERGMFVYLMSLKPGHFKTYSLPENSFWCCVGTGMENHAKYGDSIYFHDANQLYVNLFIPSEVDWKEKGVKLRQETKFPESDNTTLTVHCKSPAKFALRIRVPSWVAEQMQVKLKGEEKEVRGVGAKDNGLQAMKIRVQGKPQRFDATGGGYVSIQREWRDNDQVEIQLPLHLRTEPLPGVENTVALVYGPIVLAAELGKEGMPNPYAKDQGDLLNVPSPKVPVFIADATTLVARTKPVAGQPLTFRTEGIGRQADVTLIPFYRLNHERYSIYWRLFSEASWKAEETRMAALEAQRREREARTVDVVRPDEQLETMHKLAGEKNESGNFSGRKWRHANDGGWFSYQMKVVPNEPMVLVCTYWGGDRGNREFDVLVDGQKVASETLENNRPGEFFDVEYGLPTALTSGKEHVEVKFQAHPGKMAGGFYGASMLKAKSGGS
jgi:hypothetical protein